MDHSNQRQTPYYVASQQLARAQPMSSCLPISSCSTSRNQLQCKLHILPINISEEDDNCQYAQQQGQAITKQDGNTCVPSHLPQLQASTVCLKFLLRCFAQDTHHPHATNGSISFFPLKVAGEFNFGTPTKKVFIASVRNAPESEWGERSGKSFIKQILQQRELLSFTWGLYVTFLSKTLRLAHDSLRGRGEER